MRLVTGKHSLCACVCCANCVKEDEDGRAPSRSSCSNTDNASEAAGGIMTYRMCTAPVFCLLAMALVTAAVSTIVMIVAIASDSWEHIDYHSAKLSAIAVKDDKTDYEMVSAISVMNDDEGFYKVVLRPKNAQIIANSSEQVLYFRSVYGGIWRMCDRIKGELLVAFFVLITALQRNIKVTERLLIHPSNSLPITLFPLLNNDRTKSHCNQQHHQLFLELANNTSLLFLLLRLP